MIGNYLGHVRGFTQFNSLSTTPTSGIHVVREGIDKDLSNVQARAHMARNFVEYVDETSAKKKSIGEKKKSKHDNTRGIYHLDPEDMEFNETMTNARKKLELQMDSAMPKTSGNSSLTAPKVRGLLQRPHKEKQKLFAHVYPRRLHQSTRKWIQHNSEQIS